MQRYVEFCAEVFSQHAEPTSKQQIMSLFLTMLAQESMQAKCDQRIQTSIDLIQQQLDKAITVDCIAKQVFLSRSQFSQRFKQQTGRSFQQFLIQQRMELAKQLVVNSNLSLVQIANRVGYDNASAFSRRFFQYHAQPPSSLR